MKGCLGGCGKREERERERGECLNMDVKRKAARVTVPRVKRFVQMKINEHLIFNLTNAVRKCITLNIKAYIRIQVHICVYMYVVPTQYVGNSWPQAAFPKASVLK